jgi:hypothetical protein
MKNRYEVFEDHTILHSYNKRNDVWIEIKIDTEDLPIAQSHPGNWYPFYEETMDSYYIVGGIKVDGKKKTIRLHRLIMNAPDGYVVDHISGDTTDNRRCNLRICKDRENSMNRKNRKNSLSPYKGVYFHIRDKRYIAQLCIDGEYVWIGYFTTEKDAALAYDCYARIHFGEYAKLNFPDEQMDAEEVEKRKYKRKTSSQYIGVHLHNGKWQVVVKHNKEKFHIGTFDHEVTASIARDIAVFKLKGANAKFNHEDIFNASTVTYDAIAADPKLYHHTG